MGYTEKQQHYVAIFMQHVDIVLAILNRRKKTKLEAVLEEANNVVNLANAAFDLTTNVVSVLGIATAVPSAGMSLAVAGGVITALQTSYAGYRLVQRYWNGDEQNPLSEDEMATAEKQLRLKIICNEVADLFASSRYYYFIQEIADEPGIASFARYGANRALKKIFTDDPALNNLNHLNAEKIADYVNESTKLPDKEVSVLPAFKKVGKYYAKWAYSRPQAVCIDFKEKEPCYQVFTSSKEKEYWRVGATQNSTLAKYGYVLLPPKSLSLYKKHREAGKKAILDEETQQKMRPYYETSRQEVAEYLDAIKLNTSLSFHDFLATRLGMPVIAFYHDDLLGLSLENGNFSGVDFRRANLRGCSLRNSQWLGAKLDEAKLGGEDILLAGATFQGASAQGSSWEKVNFGGADFSDTLMYGAHLNMCSLQGIIFINSRWEGAVFNNMQHDNFFAAFRDSLNEEAVHRLNMEKQLKRLDDDVASLKSQVSSLILTQEGLKKQVDLEAERQSEKVRKNEENKVLFERLQNPPTGELASYVVDMETWLKRYARAQEISEMRLTDDLITFAFESFDSTFQIAQFLTNIPTETDTKKNTSPIDIHRLTRGAYAPLRFTRNKDYAWVWEGCEAYFQAKALWKQFRETPNWILPSSWIYGNFSDSPALLSFLAHFQTENDHEKLLFHWREHEELRNNTYQNIDDILNEHAEDNPHCLFHERQQYFVGKTAEKLSLETHKTAEEIKAAWLRGEHDVISLREPGIWEASTPTEIAIGPLSGLSPKQPPYEGNLPLQKKRSTWHRAEQYIADQFWQQLEQMLKLPAVNMGNILALFPQCLARQLQQVTELLIQACKTDDTELQASLRDQQQNIYHSKLFRLEVLVTSMPRIKNAYANLSKETRTAMKTALLKSESQELVQWLAYQFAQAVPEEFMAQCRHETASFYQRGWQLWLTENRQGETWQRTADNKQQWILQKLSTQAWDEALTLFQGTSVEDWESALIRIIQEGRQTGFARYRQHSSMGFKKAWESCSDEDREDYETCAQKRGFQKLGRDLAGLYEKWAAHERLDLKNAMIEDIKVAFNAWIDTDKIKPYWSRLSLVEKRECQQALETENIHALKDKLSTVFSIQTLQKSLKNNMYHAFKEALFPVLHRFADTRSAWANFSAEEQESLMNSAFQGKWKPFAEKITGYLFRPTSDLLDKVLDKGLHPDACASDKPLLWYAIDSACGVAQNPIPEKPSFSSVLPNETTLYFYPQHKDSLLCCLKTPHGVYLSEYTGPDLALFQEKIAKQEMLPLHVQAALVQYIEASNLTELIRRLELVYYLLDSGVVTGSIFSSAETNLSYLLQRAHHSWMHASEEEKPLWAKLGKVLNWFTTFSQDPQKKAALTQSTQDFRSILLENYWPQFIKENQSSFSWRGRARDAELRAHREQQKAMFVSMSGNIPAHLSHFYDFCATIEQMAENSPRGTWDFGLFKVSSPLKGRLAKHAETFLKEVVPTMHGSGTQAGLIEWGGGKTTRMELLAFPHQGLMAFGTSFLPTYSKWEIDPTVHFVPDTGLQLARAQQALEDITEDRDKKARALDDTAQALKKSEETNRGLLEQLSLLKKKPDNKDEKRPFSRPGFF